MGLDMYLEKKNYIGNNYVDKKSKMVKVVVPKNQDGKIFPVGEIKNERVTYITEQIGYWRKANAIHKWFVDNVQSGNDDCGTYYVSKEKLKELLDTCNRVIEASKLVRGTVVTGIQHSKGKTKKMTKEGGVIEDPSTAEELLPVQSGFFFGGTDYDEYYLNDIKYTKTIMKSALKEKGGSIYYTSNW